MAGCEGLFDLFDNDDKFFPLEDQYKIKFNQGDTLTYTDQSGTIFRLVISEIRYTTHARSRKGSSGPYNIFERQAVYYDSVFSSSATWGGIFTQQPTGYVNWPPGLYGTGVGGEFNYHEQVTLNSKVYRAVYKLEGESRAPGFITTWYYSYAYGFVAFDRSNGQLFTLEIP